VVVIACEPAEIEEPGLGLSPEVEAAVPRAVDLALEALAGLHEKAARASAG